MVFNRVGVGNPRVKYEELEKGKIYPIPAEATHIGVQAGRIGFFKSECPSDYHSGRRWKFYRIPENKQQCSFPDYVRPLRSNGFQYYGQPIFRS